MRPTIPFLDWRIAVALEETASLPDLIEMPARGCDCESCANWRRAYRYALPEDVITALERLGLRAGQPADLYAFERKPLGSMCRARYYLVGKLLEGPVAFRDDPAGRVCLYRPVSTGEREAGVNIYPARASNLPEPEYLGEGGELIVVDFRLAVPEVGT